MNKKKINLQEKIDQKQIVKQTYQYCSSKRAYKNSKNRFICSFVL